MKKYLMTLFALLTMTVGANAMSYEQARREALFLTDKMAYELNLSDAQYEAAYEVNLDYLMSVTGRDDVFGYYWECRNMDLSYILYTWQWEAFRAATYFYRPLFWEAGYWHFGVYAHYPRRDYFYFGRPHFYVSYRGGHSWRSNGGRSFYADHRGAYRPHENARDRHSGMRDGWNRGDYRGRGGSSTRVTGGDRSDHRERGYSRERDYNRDNRSLSAGSQQSGARSGSRSNSGSFSGSRSSSSSASAARSAAGSSHAAGAAHSGSRSAGAASGVSRSAGAASGGMRSAGAASGVSRSAGAASGGTRSAGGSHGGNGSSGSRR